MPCRTPLAYRAAISSYITKAGCKHFLWRKMSCRIVKFAARGSLDHVTDIAAFDGLRQSLLPVADNLNQLGLPQWLIKFGHPGNMGVVLTAMGGYGSWLGWQLRLGNEDELVMEKAKDLHPKLMGGMFFFFTLGATGGIFSEVMQGRPLLSSPHFTTAVIGLLLLAVQATLSTGLEEQPELRGLHAFLGTGIMALFVAHAMLGLQLAVSL